MGGTKSGGRSRLGGLLVAMVAATVGCAGEGGPASVAGALHPVSGTVLHGGKPAAGVEVRLHPLNRVRDESAPSPRGTTDAQGRFRLRTGEADGAPNGQYLATLAWPAARGGGDRLGGAFAEPDGSGLTAVVDDSTVELPAFEVGAAAATRRGVSP